MRLSVQLNKNSIQPLFHVIREGVIIPIIHEDPVFLKRGEYSEGKVFVTRVLKY